LIPGRFAITVVTLLDPAANEATIQASGSIGSH